MTIMHGLADGLQKFALGIGMRGMGAEGEGEDGIELAELCDNLLSAIPEFAASVLEGVLLAILKGPYHVKAGQILKFLKIHGGRHHYFPGIRGNLIFRCMWLNRITRGLRPKHLFGISSSFLA
jgi:hypothetical protein